MAFDDDHLKDSEERFQKQLNLAREFNNIDLPQILEKIDFIMPFISVLTENSNRTPKEDEILKRYTEVAAQLKMVAENYQLVLSEKLFRDSRAYYDHIRKLAKEGNEDAKRNYEDLKKDFPDDFSSN